MERQAQFEKPAMNTPHVTRMPLPDSYFHHYVTVADAKTALDNSGVYEWFAYDTLPAAAEWMYRNDATPEEAATHFKVD